MLKSLGATVAIVAECTRCVHGAKDTALGFGDHDRPRLTEAEWPRVCAGLAKFAALSAAAGLKLVYHHHMGTVIQSEAELDRLLASVPASWACCSTPVISPLPASIRSRSSAAMAPASPTCT